jgi:hypothetical protein
MQPMLLACIHDPMTLEFDDGSTLEVPPSSMVYLPDENPLHMRATLRGETCEVTVSWPSE